MSCVWVPVAHEGTNDSRHPRPSDVHLVNIIGAIRVGHFVDETNGDVSVTKVGCRVCNETPWRKDYRIASGTTGSIDSSPIHDGYMPKIVSGVF